MMSFQTRPFIAEHHSSFEVLMEFRKSLPLPNHFNLVTTLTDAKPRKISPIVPHADRQRPGPFVVTQRASGRVNFGKNN